ncbi:MAG: hypothetical protein JNK15_06390, partial [Planctomycetes bacterium]|nr:hypothetical protein [Planctomycetota bacterium]
MLRFAFAAALLAAPGLAQHCFNGNFGTRLGTGTVDTVFPIQSIGFAFPFAGTTYTDIHVNDHGFVELSNAGVPAPLTTNAAQLYTPIVANFAAGAPKIAPLYCDMECTGGGEVWISSSASECVVTWWNVQSFGISTPRFSFQLVLEPSGTIHFVYGPGVTNNSTWGGSSDNGICGVSPAGGVVLPPVVDLSAGGVTTNDSTYENWATANTFDLGNNTLMLVPTSPGFAYLTHGAPANCAAASSYGVGCDAVLMQSIGFPSFGNPAYTLQIVNVPLVSPIAVVGFGTTVVNPGAPLDPIGMVGCSAYTDLGIGLFTSGPVVAGVSNFSFGIPNNTAYLGLVFSSQGLTLSTANAAGLAASNGVQFTIG